MTAKTLEMKEALIENFRNSLNKKSKWYDSDLAEFKNNLDKVSESKILEMYNNMIAFNSKSFEKFVEKEEQKLLKGGMYNINNLKPKNCLD